MPPESADLPQAANPTRAKKPPHEATDRTRGQVEMLTSYGIPQEEIAELIGCSKRTLLRHYKKEIRLGVAKDLTRLHSKIRTTAFNGSGRTALRAQIYLLQQHERRIERATRRDAKDVGEEIATERDSITPSGPVPDKPVL